MLIQGRRIIDDEKENHSNDVLYGEYSFSLIQDFKDNYSPNGVDASFEKYGIAGVEVTSNKIILPSAVGKQTSGDDLLSLQSNVKVVMQGTIDKETDAQDVQIGNVTIKLSNTGL